MTVPAKSPTPSLALLGRNPAACRALDIALDEGMDVRYVVAPESDGGRQYGSRRLASVAREAGIPVGSLEELERAAADGGIEAPDALVSFLFWRKVPTGLLTWPKLGAFNFHPGPLPEFSGARGYNHAILEGSDHYGATLHWMTEEFDRGDIVDIIRFPLEEGETASSLYRRTMASMLELWRRFVTILSVGAAVPRTPQGPADPFVTRRELLAMMAVDPTADAEEIALRARAFWFPPFHGAFLELDGTKFTLVDSATLERLGAMIHDLPLEEDW